MFTSNNDQGVKSPYGAGSSFQNVGAIDLNKFAPLYNFPEKKPSGPEYIPYNTRGRDFYGRLSFNTGLYWLGGFVSGGTYGLIEGWRGAVNPNYKIHFNNVLNAVSRRGSSLASALGVVGTDLSTNSFHCPVLTNYFFYLAFMHTSSVWVADNLEIEKQTGQALATPIFAGVVTGGLYKSMRGVRAAALASVIGAGLSCAYWYGSNYTYDVLLGKKGKY
jgi:hypothetical protein